ncbi:MAG: hypothetical protein O2797_06240 [Bacteroidetes bacterium]|nr:hypothetical protein [Bacteroidota bacterium]
MRCTTYVSTGCTTTSRAPELDRGSDFSFEAKLVADVTYHVNRYQERFDSLTVYHTERMNLREPERSSLKELGDCYCDRPIRIFKEGLKSEKIRSSIDCKFAGQAVIGMCDRWGHLIVPNPDLDMTNVIESSIDLLINGFIDKASSDEISVRI